MLLMEHSTQRLAEPVIVYHDSAFSTISHEGPAAIGHHRGDAETASRDFRTFGAGHAIIAPMCSEYFATQSVLSRFESA